MPKPVSDLESRGGKKHSPAATGKPPGVEQRLRSTTRASSAGLELPLAQLSGLGEALHGLGRIIAACADSVAQLADAKPQQKIGKWQTDFGYTRYRKEDDDSDGEYENRFVRSGKGKAVGCGGQNTAVLTWFAFQDIGKRKCSDLSGSEIQTFINDQVKAAETAAAALCTDDNCPSASTDLTFQEWACTGTLLTVNLHLELTCSKSKAV